MLEVVCDLKDWFSSLLQHLHVKLTFDVALIAFVDWLIEKANAISILGGLFLLAVRIFCVVIYAWRYYREKPEGGR